MKYLTKKLKSRLKSISGILKQQLLIYIFMSFFFIFPIPLPPSGSKVTGTYGSRYHGLSYAEDP